MGRGDMTTFLAHDDVDFPVLCDVDDAMIAKGIKAVEDARNTRPDAVKDFRHIMDRKDARSFRLPGRAIRRLRFGPPTRPCATTQG